MSENQLAGIKWKFEQRTIYVWIKLHLNLLWVTQNFQVCRRFHNTPVSESVHVKSWKVFMLHLKIWLLKETLMYRTVLWTLWERERVGRFGRMALKHVKYHVWNEWPVQVRCTILDAWGWCTGTTQRDGMGREDGGGFRMGNTCIPVADSFQYLAKPMQYCKV